MKIPYLSAAFLAAAALLTLAPVSVVHAQTAKPGWTDNQVKALEKAKAEKKLILMDFTGSDWCPWCMKLDKEIFNTPEFKTYAKDNLVLVELDYPRQRFINFQTKKQNEELKKQYEIKGYPTVIVLDADGKQVKQLGYQEGGPKPFIDELQKLKTS